MRLEPLNRDLRLDIALRATGQTQRGLAQRTGMSIFRVHRIVRGRARARAEEREAIAASLGLPADALFDDREQ